MSSKKNELSAGGAIADRGTIFWRISKRFQFAADRLIPDAFVFCTILAIITFVAAVVVTGTDPLTMTTYWYDGFWTQSTFAFQMTILVVICAAFAQAPAVRKVLDRIATLAHTPRGCMVVLMIFGYIASFINWAFSTVACPILAMRMAKNCKGLHFPMMVAAGYSTMILGQCMGPSASVYALVAGEGHFLAEQIGVLPQSITTYNPMNVVLFFIVAIVTIIVSVLSTPPASETIEYHAPLEDMNLTEEKKKATTPAEAMNGSRLLMYIIAALGLVYIIWSFFQYGILASLSLNFIIFVFITANALAYNSPQKFISALKESMPLATDIMIQFPFYGAIMQMMTASGLGQVIIDTLSTFTTQATMPLVTFLSACVLNLFIPSQGGQWIVQGPIMIPLALEKGAYIPDILNAFVYGDETTNLLQPLYMIPALAVVNMPLKKIWGYCAYLCVIWIVLISIGLLILPGIFNEGLSGAALNPGLAG